MQPNLLINIGKLKLKNPVMAASGTFGYAEEFKDFINLKKLGAIVTKTITLNPRQGNPPSRTCETPAGMLNSIGLENPGLRAFIEEKLPLFRKIGIPIIVSIAADDPKELTEIVKRLNKTDINAIELNLSCPNVKRDKFIGLKPETQVAQHAPWTKVFVSSARKATKKILITKLSPNVTDIVAIAKTAQNAGADAISLVNTFLGLSIDVNTRKPKLGNITGGLSGPAIRPVAVRMTWEVYQKIKIPIIGMGGIIDTPSALEFFIAGASAISIGTANFINPRVSVEVIAGIKEYLIKNNIKDIENLIGSLKV